MDSSGTDLIGLLLLNVYWIAHEQQYLSAAFRCRKH